MFTYVEQQSDRFMVEIMRRFFLFHRGLNICERLAVQDLNTHFSETEKTLAILTRRGAGQFGENWIFDTYSLSKHH